MKEASRDQKRESHGRPTDNGDRRAPRMISQLIAVKDDEAAADPRGCQHLHNMSKLSTSLLQKKQRLLFRRCLEIH